MPKPKGKGGGRPAGRGKPDKKEPAIRTDDVYEADEADPDELRHASRYDVRPAREGPWHPTGPHAYAGGAPWQCMRPLAPRAARLQPPLPAALPPLTLRSVLAPACSFLQQVESYEYEMPSDFEDEDIDDEMAFTGAGSTNSSRSRSRSSVGGAAAALSQLQAAAERRVCMPHRPVPHAG